MTVKNVKGTSNTEEPVIFKCSGAKPCQNVTVGDIDLQYVGLTKNISVTSTVCTHVKPTVVGKSNVAICNSAPAAAA